MRLPDPFTHPGKVPGFQTAELVDNDPVIRDELPNGKVGEVKIAAQYFGINISYPDLYESEFAILDSFVKEYKRTGGYIDVVLPQYERFRLQGNVGALRAQSGQKGSMITVLNTASVVGVPQMHDLFKLSTNSKVYKITKVEVLSGKWNIYLYPDLAITTNGSEVPVFSGIVFRTKLMNGDAFVEHLDADGVYSGFALNLRESL